ncbi:hypothetical protein GCM10025789_27640 [Tessaracoccus lubricantis]|uniref:Uncharacterized protein n=1 Tax=Tessaracoccus lubricantis TaxID=545543 RepID=A0ABP9FLH6_9ACTN
MHQLTAFSHDTECTGASAYSASGARTPSTREYKPHVTGAEAMRNSRNSATRDVLVLASRNVIDPAGTDII